MRYKQVLGLNEEQIKIVKALSSGPQNISDLAEKAKVPRTSILAHLKKFERRQIVRKELKGKRFLWKINEADIIERSFYKNLQELGISRSVEEKNVLQRTEGLQVTYRYGVKSIYEIWDEISNLPKHARIYGIQPDSSFKMAIERGLELKSLKSLIDVNNRIKENQIIVEAIVHEKSVESLTEIIRREASTKAAADFFESFQGRLADTVKLPDGFLDHNSEIYITESTLYIVSWDGLYAVTIKDRNLVLLCKGLFDALKHLCERYDQGAKMAQKIVSLSKKNL
jgi:sugar-specific transcriptional regulator TrmB